MRAFETAGISWRRLCILIGEGGNCRGVVDEVLRELIDFGGVSALDVVCGILPALRPVARCEACRALLFWKARPLCCRWERRDDGTADLARGADFGLHGALFAEGDAPAPFLHDGGGR